MGHSIASSILSLLTAAAAVAQEPPPTVLTGRAIDRDGKPMAACAVGVFAEGEDFDTAALLARPSVTTDITGGYRIERSPGRGQVVVVAKKGFQVCVLPLEPTATGVFDALMLPGGTLTGRVRDASGNPIPGAWVRVGDPFPEGGGDSPNPSFQSNARTDERGIFAVPGVPRTGLRVEAHAPGFPGVRVLAAHDTPLDLTLTATGLVRGRVVDAAGRPVPAILVTVRTVEQRAVGERIRTDAEGRFTLTAPDAFRFVVAAMEADPPYRGFASDLQHGPADDVLVTPVAPPADTQRIRVRCIDAATKAPIEQFHASMSAFGAADALLRHPVTRTAYRGGATFEVAKSARRSRSFLAVDAPGCGAVAVAIDKIDDGPLVVELSPECTLRGRVLDAQTGKPVAGCAVRALPNAKWRLLGGGPDPWRFGSVSDADGWYRIGGLSAGDYFVQAYGVGRPSTHGTPAPVVAGAPTTVDVELEAALFSTLELVGDIPPGCLATIWFDGINSVNDQQHGTAVHWRLPLPAPVPLVGARPSRIGPFDDRSFCARLFLPTRDRLGSGLTIDLGPVDTQGTTRLQLPDLRTALHRGRVRLPADVPPARIGLLAHLLPDAGEGDRWSRPLRDRPFLACLDSEAGFTIELPLGRYVFQLLDLETGLVFHTDEAERAVRASPSRDPIEIAPTCRWLTLQIEPTASGGPVVLHGIKVIAPRPRDESLPAMLGRCGGDNHSQHMTIPCPPRASQLRWLVPTATIHVQAMQSFGLLSRLPNYRTTLLDMITVESTAAAPVVTLRIPPPPSDSEWSTPSGK